MVIVFAAGASLRPLPFIIFTTNFLPDHWICHVEEAKDNAPEMSEMSNPSTCPLHGSKEFNEAEDDHKVFSGYWEEKVDVDEAVWKEPTKGEEQPVDGSGGSDDGHDLKWRKNHSTDSSTDSAEEEKS
jgi:hypothetical protein